MQIESAHITWKSGTTEFKHCSASIDVPGLGKVEIKDFISDDLRNRIEAEAIFSLNQKLGITCEAVMAEKIEDAPASS
jgi:hypothetical protein